MSARRIVLAALCVASVTASALAAPRTYGIDEDPLRLGAKALEKGELAKAAEHFREAIAAGYKVPFATLGLADVASREGRAAEAETLYRDALRARHAEGAALPEANARLGLLLLRAGKTAEAAAEFDAAFAAKPDVWEAQYGRARLALDAGDAAAAEALLANGAKRKGAAEGEDLYHHGRALLRFAEKDFAAAELEAREAIALDPAVPEYAALLGRIYEARGTPAMAIDAYEKMLAAPGSKPTAPMLHTLGRLYARESRWNDARDAYVRAVEADSTFGPALKDLADVFRLGKQHERAARTYLRYVASHPADAEALTGLAESYRELGQLGPAFETAERAVAAAPDSEAARKELVRAGVRSTDPAQRARAVETAAGLPDSTTWDAAELTALASAQMDAQANDAARAGLERALAADPESADAWYHLGLLEMRESRPDSAVTALERAAAARADSPLIHLNLGIALYQARRLGEAIPAFRAALALRPELTAGRLLLAQTLAASDSVRAAEAEYEQVLAAEPGNAKALRGLGFCRIRRADYRGAADAYEAAARAEPGNADAWAGLGNARLGLQDWGGAEQAFGKAKAIDPSNPTLIKGMELLEKSKTSG